MIVKRAIFIVLCVTLFFFLWLGQEQQRFMNTGTISVAELPYVGHSAPDFTLPLLQEREKEVQLSSVIEESNGIVVYFWTSWCPFCSSSMDALQRAYEQFGGEVTFIGVNVTNEDTIPAATKFIQEHGMEFISVTDDKGSVSSSYFVPPVPATFILDGNGVIVHRKVGAITYTEIQQVIQQWGRES